MTLAPGLPPTLGEGSALGAAGKGFGPLAQLPLPPGPAGVTAPQSGWTWQGRRDRAPSTNKGPFSVAGKRLALVKLGWGVVWLLLTPPPPHITHWGETLAVTLLRAAEAGMTVSPPQLALVPIGLYCSPTFPISSWKWEVQEDEGQCSGGACGHSGATKVEWGPLPCS